jgi:hypothetical protein
MSEDFPETFIETFIETMRAIASEDTKCHFCGKLIPRIAFDAHVEKCGQIEAEWD